MNGPRSMYRMKPLIPHDSVPLPTCMYKMKNVHDVTNGFLSNCNPPNGTTTNNTTQNTTISTITSPKQDPEETVFDQAQADGDAGMAEIAQRQEKLLESLANLRKQMLKIKEDLKLSEKQSPAKVNVNTKANINVPAFAEIKDHPEIIINASPHYPPYSLLLLRKLWTNEVNFPVEIYKHSSLKSLTPQALDFTRKMESFRAKCSSPSITIRLIWKSVDTNTEMIISHLPLIGEINILRFFARLSNNSLCYELDPNVHEIDSLLDICFSLVMSKTKTERNILLHVINGALGKSQWLLGRNNISIADMAAYSSIKQTDCEINANLVKWISRIENLA